MTIQSVDYVGRVRRYYSYHKQMRKSKKYLSMYLAMQIKDYMEVSIEECNDIVDRLITFSNNVERIEASHE